MAGAHRVFPASKQTALSNKSRGDEEEQLLVVERGRAPKLLTYQHTKAGSIIHERHELGDQFAEAVPASQLLSRQSNYALEFTHQANYLNAVRGSQ